MNLAQNITKESDPVRQKHYTTKKAWLVDVINIFWFILILFLFQRRYLISANIIHTDLRIRTFHTRFLYQHFLSGITEKSLNVFYYACSYAKVDYSRFMNTTVRIVLKLIPDSLQTQPVFLCVDDTMISKFGTKFENVSKLFDHAAHNGSNYLNGHCFVSVMLCVPVWNGDKVYYLSLTFCFEYSSNNWLAL